MRSEADQWISRCIDAYLIVARRINAQMKDCIPETLTNDQFLMLRLINFQPRCTSTYLAESALVAKSSITAIVSRLEEAGMIERSRDESDRRQIYLSLTDKGRQSFAQSERMVQDLVSPYLNHFEVRDIETFVTMFETLAERMQDTGGRSG